MSRIPFTDRELKRAWQALSSVATAGDDTLRQNPHRLLLFYAVECGLKYAWLKRQRRSIFDDELIADTGHDLRGLLGKLRVGADLSLPNQIHLTPVKQNGKDCQRHGSGDILHQVWRYGGECLAPDDDRACETQLLKIQEWLRGEIEK